MHWAAKYIGIPYEAGARGPEKADCWGLVRMIYWNEFYIELPLFPGLSLIEKPVETATAIKQGLEEDWKEEARPFDGALVAMSKSTEVHHIGVYADADGGRILHCWNAQHSIVDTERFIRLKGIRLIKYYKHRLWPT